MVEVGKRWGGIFNEEEEGVREREENRGEGRREEEEIDLSRHLDQAVFFGGWCPDRVNLGKKTGKRRTRGGERRFPAAPRRLVLCASVLPAGGAGNSGTGEGSKEVPAAKSNKSVDTSSGTINHRIIIITQYLPFDPSNGGGKYRKQSINTRTCAASRHSTERRPEKKNPANSARPITQAAFGNPTTAATPLPAERQSPSTAAFHHKNRNRRLPSPEAERPSPGGPRPAPPTLSAI